MASETVGEACVRAHEAVAAAESERARVWRLAIQSGTSYRELARLMGLSASTVYRAVGKGTGPGPRGSLDRPLAEVEKEGTDGE